MVACKSERSSRGQTGFFAGKAILAIRRNNYNLPTATVVTGAKPDWVLGASSACTATSLPAHRRVRYGVFSSLGPMVFDESLHRLPGMHAGLPVPHSKYDYSFAEVHHTLRHRLEVNRSACRERMSRRSRFSGAAAWTQSEAADCLARGPHSGRPRRSRRDQRPSFIGAVRRSATSPACRRRRCPTSRTDGCASRHPCSLYCTGCSPR